MASTWREMTNDVLRLSLLPVIASDVIFDDDNALQEFQSASKWYVRLAHKYLTLRAVKHFASRRIELPVSAGTATYALDLGINPSAIEYRSFFNVTTGTNGSGDLSNYDYDLFVFEHPDLAQVPTGTPRRWILLPLERSQDPNAIQKVRIYPTPDANYTLQYRAKLNAYRLQSASDVVLWPEEYEHALWIFSWAQVERALGEGKEGVLDELARKASSDVQLVSGVPEDNKRAIRTMAPIRSSGSWPLGRSTGWVDSPLG